MSLIVKLDRRSANGKKTNFSIADITAAFQSIRNDKRKLVIDGKIFDLKTFRVDEEKDGGLFLCEFGSEEETKVRPMEFAVAISQIGKTQTNFIIAGEKHDLSTFEFALEEMEEKIAEEPVSETNDHSLSNGDLKKVFDAENEEVSEPTLTDEEMVAAVEPPVVLDEKEEKPVVEEVVAKQIPKTDEKKKDLKDKKKEDGGKGSKKNSSK